MDKANGGAFPFPTSIAAPAVLTRVSDKPKSKKQGNSLSKRKPRPDLRGRAQLRAPARDSVGRTSPEPRPSNGKAVSRGIRVPPKALPDVGGRESRIDGPNCPEYRSRDALEPTVIVDLQGRIVDLNDEVVRTYGWTRDDLLDEPVAQDGPDNRSLEERLEQCRKGETIRRVNKSGREHKGLLTLSLLTDERGALERSP